MRKERCPVSALVDENPSMSSVMSWRECSGVIVQSRILVPSWSSWSGHADHCYVVQTIIYLVVFHWVCVTDNLPSADSRWNVLSRREEETKTDRKETERKEEREKERKNQVGCWSTLCSYNIQLLNNNHQQTTQSMQSEKNIPFENPPTSIPPVRPVRIKMSPAQIIRCLQSTQAVWPRTVSLSNTSRPIINRGKCNSKPTQS